MNDNCLNLFELSKLLRRSYTYFFSTFYCISGSLLISIWDFSDGTCNKKIPTLGPKKNFVCWKWEFEKTIFLIGFRWALRNMKNIEIFFASGKSNIGRRKLFIITVFQVNYTCLTLYIINFDNRKNVLSYCSFFRCLGPKVWSD